MNDVYIEKIRNLKTQLTDLFTRLGINFKLRNESLNFFYHAEGLTAHKFSRIPAKLYWKLARTYGESLTLEIKIGGFVEYFQNKALKYPDLIEFRRRLRTREIDGMLDVDISIDKGMLAKQVLGNPKGINATVVFQQDILTDILSEPIVDLDKRSKISKDNDNKKDVFCYDDFSKQVILIPDIDIWVDGARLAIVGGRGLSRIMDVLVPPPSNKLPSPERTRVTSELNIKWIRLAPPNLTPLHFDVEINKELSGKEAEGIFDLLASLKISLSLMYIADTVHCINHSFIEVMFIGAGCSAKVKLRHPFSKKIKRAALRKAASIWYEDFFWAYGDKIWISDKLSTIQCAIANAFPISDNTQMTDYLTMAETMHGLIRENWKIFTNEKVDKYFDKIKEINEFVASATRAYGEQIDGLIKSLSTTMLGAVVAVVGSFVGALLKEDFNRTVLIIGLAVYSVYLAIFPGVIGMKNSREYFSEMKKRMNQQFTDLRKRIISLDKDKKKWASLKEQLKSSEDRFKDWFRITKTVYIIVFLLSLIAIAILSVF